MAFIFSMINTNEKYYNKVSVNQSSILKATDIPMVLEFPNDL